MRAPSSRRWSAVAQSGPIATLILTATLVACQGDGTTAPTPSLGAANGPNGKNAIVRVTPRSDTLDALGATLQLTANVSSPTWNSLTPAVVTVDAQGLVRAVGIGYGRIEAVVGRKADTADVLVHQIPVSLTVTPDDISLLGFFEVDTLTAVVSDANGYPVPGAPIAWSSDDPTIATVVDGVVTAYEVGVTWVRAVFAALSDSARVESVAGPYP